MLVLLTLEGVVRASAAVTSGEAFPSFPIYILAFVHNHLDAQGHEMRLGARIRDEIQPIPQKESLQISSCREKPWSQLTTISHQGVFYELVSQTKGSGPRPFVYVLRRKLPTAVIRGICSYDPDEVLQGRN